MKRGLWTLAAVAVLCAQQAFAAPAEAPADVFLTTQGDGQYLARDLLLGAKVQNAEGQIVGDVEDLILNADNQVVGVVMGIGGFAGFGEKRIGVRLSALKITNEEGKVTVSLPQATKEVLDGLEPFKRLRSPKSLIDRAIEKARELTDKSTVTARDAYERAKEEAGPALQKARKAAEETYEQVKDKAGPALEGAREAAEDAYKRATEAVETPEPPPADAPDAAAKPAEGDPPANQAAPAPESTPQEPAKQP